MTPQLHGGCTHGDAVALLLPPRRRHRSSRGSRDPAAPSRCRHDAPTVAPSSRPTSPTSARASPRPRSPRGREPGSVTLVVVTKTWPASDVRLLAGLGVTDVAENRDQEARPKQAACADLGLRWHFVGQLQRNKARHVVAYADVVESVDRPELATALDRAAAEAGRTIDVLLQVDLADPPAAAPRRRRARPTSRALADHVARRARRCGWRGSWPWPRSGRTRARRSPAWPT